MKWENPGHEFDDNFGAFFRPSMGVYIYGAGETGEILYEQIEFLECVRGFIDNGFQRKINSLHGKSVETIVSFGARLNDEMCRNNIFIVAASRVNEPLMLNQLRRLGNGKIRDGINLFSSTSFLDFYLPIFAFYCYDKLVIKEVSMSLTLRCTLRCKNCAGCIPLQKNPRDFSLAMLMETLDSFFEKVDYVSYFELAGGEPLLFCELIELVKYIGENYRDKCYNLRITTNGTLVPSDELCMLLNQYNISVMLDDYGKSISVQLYKMPEIIEKLDKYKIDYMINGTEYWFDMGIGEQDNTHMSEDELESLYTACSWNCMQLYDNKLYQCGLTFYALESGLVDDEYAFSLSGDEHQGKKELLEYSYRYLPKGYANICKKCSGDYTVNTHLIKAAIQSENR